MLSAAQRLADFIRELAESSPASVDGTAIVQWHLPQHILGQLLGLSTVHTNRVMHSLSATGAISYGKGYVTVENFPLLRRAAGRSDH